MGLDQRHALLVEALGHALDGCGALAAADVADPLDCAEHHGGDHHQGDEDLQDLGDAEAARAAVILVIGIVELVERAVLFALRVAVVGAVFVVVPAVVLLRLRLRGALLIVVVHGRGAAAMAAAPAGLVVLQLADVLAHVTGDARASGGLDRAAAELGEVDGLVGLQLLVDGIQGVLGGLEDGLASGKGRLGRRARLRFGRFFRLGFGLRLRRHGRADVLANVLRHGAALVHGPVGGAAVGRTALLGRVVHAGIGGARIAVQRLEARLTGRNCKLGRGIRDASEAVVADGRLAARTDLIVRPDGFPALRAKHAMSSSFVPAFEFQCRKAWKHIEPFYFT